MKRCGNPYRSQSEPRGMENRAKLLKTWSGRRDSNPRRPAWEAGILPLNYSRTLITAPLCYQIFTWGTHHSEPVQGRILHEHRTALIQKAVDQKIRFVLSMILLFLTSTCPECLTSAAPYELPFGTW